MEALVKTKEKRLGSTSIIAMTDLQQQLPDVPLDFDAIKTDDKADDDFRAYCEETRIIAMTDLQHQRPDVPLDFEAIKTNAKADDDFRVYSEESSPVRVVQHYKDMRLHHTVDFYRRMEEKYSFENGTFRREMTVDEAFTELEHYVDASDPDLELPNKLHLLQTAEGIRRAGHPDWFQLTGLLHE